MSFVYEESPVELRYDSKRFKMRANNVMMNGCEFIEKLQRGIISGSNHPVEMVIHSITHHIRNLWFQYIVLNVRMTVQDYRRLSLIIPDEYGFDIYDN